MNAKQRQVDGWTLVEVLGRGGNAEVWRATGEGQTVALKMVNATKVEREPYRRFVQEVKFLRTLVDFPGVLPILDASLPDKPSKSNPAWLAMPIATPADQALVDADIDTVVDAVLAFASTLARLHGEHSAGHRDIKPGNLYSWNGVWAVGDFGLVAYPDGDALTEAGKPAGPRHFAPYELIASADTADPFPVDVFGLGKTMWVFLTGQNFPPPGHQPAVDGPWSVAANRPHAKSPALDQLIDRMTRIDPQARPTIDEVVRDLLAWKQLERSPHFVDVSDLATIARQKLATELNRADRSEQQRNDAINSARQLQEYMKSIGDSFASIHPKAQISINPDKMANSLLRSFTSMGSELVTWSYGRMHRIESGASHMPYVIRAGCGLELTASGGLRMLAFVDVGLDGVMQTDYMWQRRDESTQPVGSLQAAQMLNVGMAEFAERVHQGLSTFVENLGSR